MSGKVDAFRVGKAVGAGELDVHGRLELARCVSEFDGNFGYDVVEITGRRFTKLFPR